MSDHIFISTEAVVRGTVAIMSCEAGFIFPTGELVVATKCVNYGDSGPVWNITQPQCQREFELVVLGLDLDVAASDAGTILLPNNMNLSSSSVCRGRNAKKLNVF